MMYLSCSLRVMAPLLLLGIMCLGACTKINQVEVPPPDFEKLIVETGTFIGSRINNHIPALVQDDYEVKVISKSSKIYFQEEVEIIDINGNLVTEIHEYEVNFDIPEFKNAASFTIPEQVIDGTRYKGSKLYEDNNLQAHGYYEVEDTNENPINSLNFKVLINSTTWTYSLNAKK